MKLKENSQQRGSECPTVSVLMTVFNGQRFVEEAIDSILKQTFNDFEFLVIDDGSTDETPSILDGYNDPRMRVVRQANLGRGPALNRGLCEADGEFVAIIDDDDIARQTRLETQVAYFNEYPDTALVGTYYECHWVDSERSVEHVRSPVSHERILNILPKRNPFSHSTVMYRRSAALDVGGYDGTKKSCIDYSLWIRLAVNGYQFGMVDDFLNIRRKHDSRSFAFDPFDRVRHRITAAQIRFVAARQLEVPIRSYIYPGITVISGLLPDRIKSAIKRRV
jgi:glycosyltransferase involved in cell wall biosynthesis